MLSRANRKVEKKMKELLMNAEDERRHADQYKEQVRLQLIQGNDFSRVSRSYFILLFWQNPILSYFFGKCPILSYFLAILPLILVFYGVFITIISYGKIPFKSSASLCSLSKYFFPIPCSNPFFLPFSLLDTLVKCINVGESKLFS